MPFTALRSMFRILNTFENFRKCQIGSLSMGLFVENTAGMLENIKPLSDQLRILNDLLGVEIAGAPITFTPWYPAYIDFHKAVN